MFDSFRIGNRIKNMVWNTSENYSTGVKIAGANSYTDTSDVNIADVQVLTEAGMSYDEAVNASLYAAAHEGAHVKCSQMEPLKKLLQENAKKGADTDILNGIVQVTEDYRVDYTVTKKRPGYDDLRHDSMKGFVSLFGKTRSGNIKADTTKAISAWTYGIDMRELDNVWEQDLDWDMIEEVGNDIMKRAKKAKSSKDSADIAEDLYSKHFTYKSGNQPQGDGENEDDEDEDEEGNGQGESGENGESSESSENGESGNSESDESDESGNNGEGVDSGEELSDKEVEDLLNKGTLSNMMDEKGKDSIKKGQNIKSAGVGFETNAKEDLKSLKSYYTRTCGGCLWSKEKWEQIERAVCKDVHAGTGLLYLKQPIVFDNRCDYNDRKAIIAREGLQGKALQLAKKLQEDMRNAMDEDAYSADNGNVVANKVYRATKVNDNHVFSKKTFNDVGGYVVDLLIDASGSQDSRAESIRRQAFIIARACSIAKIPCRVTSYNWEGLIDFKWQYRDFDDKMSEDTEVFRYSPNHANRDGLSLLVSAYELMERPEENKIMIVLSDGCPAGSAQDIVNDLGGMNNYGSYEYTYNGRSTSGVLDTAQTVRNIRSKGIALMGIYVGYEVHLPQEKIMYGNDFAYVTTMDTFVPKVVEYLHKQILKFS
jgi:hypothetical protein